jgi:very-short-patch-repair endonuclease
MKVHRRGATPAVAVESPIDALRQMLRCANDLEVIVAVDSALQLELATRHEIERAFAGTHRGRRILSRVDASAESGIESIVRLRLRARGIRLRTQVHVSGVGRVDLLIGDRLVVELDGRQWHDRASTFESDRKRDAALVIRGYLVMRFSYNRVMYEWNAVEQELLSLIRRDRHVARGGTLPRANA